MKIKELIAILERQENMDAEVTIADSSYEWCPALVINNPLDKDNPTSEINF